MSRPAPQRLEDLGRQLAEAKGGLAEARAVEAAGSRETAADLANAEQIAICLSEEMVAAARGERLIEELIGDAEKKLAELREGLAKIVAGRATLTETARVTRDRIGALRAKLAAERSTVAPLIARRAKEVDRLERRIATVTAHQEARSATRPTPVRTVLGFRQPVETAS